MKTVLFAVLKDPGVVGCTGVGTLENYPFSWLGPIAVVCSWSIRILKTIGAIKNKGCSEFCFYHVESILEGI